MAEKKNYVYTREQSIAQKNKIRVCEWDDDVVLFLSPFSEF